MSLLNEQVKKLVENKLVYHSIDLCLTARIKFDENFTGFHGHFPNNPVLPGVIMIKVMITMYELHKKQAYILSEIKKAKFMSPVLAGEMIQFSVKADESGKGTKLQGKVTKQGKNIAAISLVLQKIKEAGSKEAAQ